MTTRFPKRAGLLCLAAIAALTAGCSSRGDRANRPENPFNPDAVSRGPRAPLSERELRLEADQSYRKAHDSLVSGDYETAITRFGQVESRYPFSEYATQAGLEKIYAQYRSFRADEAVLAADRFLREHPRHPNADYVQYLKGLTDYDRDNGIIDYLPLDSSKRDVSNARHAYDDFALLLQKYPTSRYAGDARKRMTYLRNRVAAHELSVANYYVRRGAWVAAAKRAEAIIAEYPGSPATASALLLLQECYSKLGEKQQLEEVTQLIAANTASIEASKTQPAKADARSVVNTPVAAAPAAAAPETTKPARPGLFGSLLDLIDGGLDKTYTIGGTSSTAPAESTGAPASLTSGPYSGPETVITLPLAKAEDAAPAAAPAAAATAPAAAPAPAVAPAAAAATAPPAAAAANEPAKDKPKGGFLDFLNKTYTIGGKKKPAADVSTTPPATPADAAKPAPADSSTKSGNGFSVKLDYEDADKKASEASGTAPAGNPTPPPAK
ncbi:MAG: hypothetical protein NVS9B10_17790 [Nevskia sp.]